MPNPPKPLPARLGEAFTAGSATALGVSENRLYARDLKRPFHGVRRQHHPTAKTEPTGVKHPAEVWRERHLRAVEDFLPTMRPHQFFSGWTAAAIWRLPIPYHLVRDIRHIEIGAFAPHRGPVGSGVKGSQIRPGLVRIRYHEGKWVLEPASTWAVLGPRLTLPDCVALGDGVIRTPRYPGNFREPTGVRLGEPEELLRLANIKGRRGRQSLLKALPLLRDGASSAPESHLRLALGDARLPEPELDVDVYNNEGYFLGCSELAYPELKLALEYEGDHHRTETPQWDRDIEKYQDYTQSEWEVIRVTAWLLYRQREKLIRKVREALLRRTQTRTN